MERDRQNQNEQKEVPMIVDGEMLEHIDDTITALHQAGHKNIDAAPMNEKNDKFGIRKKIANLRNKTPFVLRGNEESIDAFKSVYRKTHRFLVDHKTVTGGVVATGIIAVVAYNILKDAQKGKLPERYDGRDFE